MLLIRKTAISLKISGKFFKFQLPGPSILPENIFFEYALKVFWNITNSYKPRRIKVYKNFCIILHNINDNAKWENVMKMYELRGPLTSSSTIWIVTSFFPLTISLHTDKISKREVSSYVFLLKWNKKNYCACFSNDGTTWNTSSFLAIVISHLSMAATYTLKWNFQTFGNFITTLFSKEMIKCPRILSTSKRASIRDFWSKVSAAMDIAKGP